MAFLGAGLVDARFRRQLVENVVKVCFAKSSRSIICNEGVRCNYSTVRAEDVRHRRQLHPNDVVVRKRTT